MPGRCCPSEKRREEKSNAAANKVRKSMSKTYTIALSGESFDCPLTGQSRQSLIRSFVRPGMALLLQPEPDNEYSKTAVAVHLVREEMTGEVHYHLGYIPSKDSSWVFDALKKRKGVTVTVKEVAGGTRQKPSFGVVLNLTII